MTKTFKLEIVTPEKLVFSDELTSLVVPAYEGYLGVLAGHTPLLCTLKSGYIEIKNEKQEIRYKTTGGFMEVTPQKTIVLVEDIVS